jgi:hypothetical protein
MDASEIPSSPSTPSPSVPEISDASLWHPGPAQEAIQVALASQKLFLVFVSSPETLSKWTPLWSDSAITSILRDHAVCLRISTNTSESKMFLPLVGAEPTSLGVWVVFAGELIDSFASPDLKAEEFLERMQKAVDRAKELKENMRAVSVGPSQVGMGGASSDPRSEQLRNQLAERRAKLEAAKRQYGLDPFLSFRIFLVYLRSISFESCLNWELRLIL